MTFFRTPEASSSMHSRADRLPLLYLLPTPACPPAVLMPRVGTSTNGHHTRPEVPLPWGRPAGKDSYPPRSPALLHTRSCPAHQHGGVNRPNSHGQTQAPSKSDSEPSRPSNW